MTDSVHLLFLARQTKPKFGQSEDEQVFMRNDDFSGVSSILL